MSLGEQMRSKDRPEGYARLLFRRTRGDSWVDMKKEVPGSAIGSLNSAVRQLMRNKSPLKLDVDKYRKRKRKK